MIHNRIISAFSGIVRMECHNYVRYPIYLFCMILMPLCITYFFTDIMDAGLPTDMPVGVVDLDNSATSRKLMRNLDSYQQSDIVSYYSDISQARRAMQRCDIYAFMYIPEGLERDLLSARQPKVSFYYNNSVLLAGSLLYKEMRAISTLGGAAVGSAKMQAQGYTPNQIKATLQPIALDVHAVGNPLLNYNVALSTIIIPACLVLFIFLMTSYSIGMELKFSHSRELMSMAGDNVAVAILGKMFPQTCIFANVMWFYQYILFVHLGFPHQCSFLFIMIVGWLLVMAAEGFAVFIFSILPSMRLSMSVCALWGVLSFSVSGFTFPVGSMDKPLQLLSWMFPMRHYFMIYQMNILQGFPLYYSWAYFVALTVFILLPVLTFRHLGKIFNEYEYIQ